MKKRNRVSYKRKYIQIERRFIIAKPYAGGFSWTLAAVLGEILLKAEEMFGERDKSYTILGIDWTPGDEARTWSPGNCKHIIVQLQMDALTDRYEAYHQLAHEGIHLISPTGKADANVLEEGLAEYFAQWYLNYVFGDGWWNGTRNDKSYRDALALAKELLTIDADAIKKLRQIEPTISRITAAQIQAVCHNISPETAARLASPFVFKE